MTIEPSEFPVPTEQEKRARLTPEQYEVTQHAGTEQAFTGEYWDTHDDGLYRCIVCESPLFDAGTKFESGTGWPSFYQPMATDAVTERTDRSHGAVRTEVLCSNCGAHLGHKFDDAANQPTGLRYCMNSCSLRLDREAKQG